MIMKKLVLAMMVFLCGSSFFALAQDPVKKTQTPTEQKDSTKTEPVKEESQPAEPGTETPDSTKIPTQSAE
jgi:hypothetical protein